MGRPRPRRLSNGGTDTLDASPLARGVVKDYWGMIDAWAKESVPEILAISGNNQCESWYVPAYHGTLRPIHELVSDCVGDVVLAVMWELETENDMYA